MKRMKRADHRDQVAADGVDGPAGERVAGVSSTAGGATVGGTLTRVPQLRQRTT